MVRVKLGGHFITLAEGEEIPAEEELYEHYTYIIRPQPRGFEILRYDPYAGWKRKPDPGFPLGIMRLFSLMNLMCKSGIRLMVGWVAVRRRLTELFSH